MKYRIIGIAFAFLSLLMSCHDDQIENPTGDTRLRFTIVTAEEGIVNSRASEDATINNVYVLVFDKSGDDASLIGWAQSTPAGGSVYYATLDKVSKGVMYVFANIESVMTGGTTGATLGDIKDLLKVQLTMNGGNIIQDPRFAPMVGGPLDYNKDDEQVPVFSLVRATAKVTVKNLSNNPSYVMRGINLGNAPTQGYVFAGMGDINTKANYAGVVSGSTYSIENMMRGVLVTDPNETESLYLFESPSGNNTFVILKGEYDGVVGYHRLDLKDDQGNPLNIQRNYQYIVNIKKIQTGGYRTAKEAMDNAASNRDISWSVDVVDPSSHDIVSNGVQYLGLSNSSLVIYQTGNLTNVVATQLSFTVKNSWLAGSVIAMGDGLSLSGTSGDGKTLTLSNSDTKSQDVKINCTSSFTSGYLIFRVGDLSKILKITRSSNLTAIPGEIEFSDLSIGDCSQSGSMKNYIRFAAKPGEYSSTSDNDVFNSGTGNLYVLISANAGYGSRVAERSGEFYVASAKDEGRTKVLFYQEKLDVYTGLVQIQPYTYVGTYHRWNQTGERIIRIKTIDSDPNVKWTAVVVAGQDFIELSTTRSPDSGITIYPYGCNDITNPTEKDNAQWTTDDEIEANCQITDGRQLITGKGNNVYFRVGLKSQLASETSQPRYGLIAFIHKGGNHLIYVRQGEEADYLMRPVDIIENNGLNRTETVKISPYNVTVPDAHKGEKYYDLKENEGVFTQYPSQGGYLFKGVGNRAYIPIGIPTSDIGWTNSTNSWNLCPSGFRLPNDTGGAIATSEMRQSFWLHPQGGIASSNYANMLRGYIADGYYDRRTMRIPNTQGRTNEGSYNVYEGMTIDGVPYKLPTLVADGAYTGYAGVLLYNPVTYASIFIPATGSYNATMTSPPRFDSTGAESNFWSTTASTSYSGYNFTLAIGYYTRVFVFDNYHSMIDKNAFSLRAVKR